MGHGAVLRLRRHDQPGPEPDHLSGLDLPVYVDAAVPRACAAFLADNGADVQRIRTNIPASACSSVSW
jgi:hypothetical protein